MQRAVQVEIPEEERPPFPIFAKEVFEALGIGCGQPILAHGFAEPHQFLGKFTPPAHGSVRRPSLR
jgi:hypothetical protein